MKGVINLELSVLELQELSFLLQRINLKRKNNSYKELPIHLVIRFNNSLWSGNFVTIHDKYHIKKLDSQYESECVNVFNIFKNIELDNVPDSFFNSSVNIVSVTNKLVELIKETTANNIEKSNQTILSPILFNAVNLDNNFELPFLILDKNATYELISVIYLD